jgi:magnesium-transporting ATPase (P-type)
VGIQNGVISLFDSQRVFLQLMWFAVRRQASAVLLLQLALYLLCGPQLISGRYILYIGLLMAFLVLVQGGCYFYFFLQVKQMEMLWNKSKIQRLRKTADAWVDIKISELKVGDLILLNYNTVCPADLLILDTSETHFSEKILSTNERRISGTNHSTVKLSIRNLNPVTKGKNTPYDALKVITSKLDGYIEYEPPSDRVSEFSGIFKLNNDPKVGLISHKNMVFCGTKLLADWTIGIILYTGKNTKIMQMNKPEESFLKRLSKEAKISGVGSLLNNFVLILSLVSVAMAVIAIMLNLMASFTAPERLGVLVFYSKNAQWVGQAREILFTIHKHLVLIPHPAYITYEFVCFFAALSIERKNLWNWIVRRFKSNSTVQKNSYTGRRGMRKRSTKQFRKAARRRGGKENTISDQKEDSLSGTSSSVPIPGQRFRSLTENDQAKNFIQKTMEATSNVKIANFEVLPDLGAITHVVFDKTDTLTQPSMRVCQIISSDRIYDIIDDDNFTALISDFFKNPDEFVPDDLANQKNRESEDYSEKSQEYLKEILGEYVPDIQDESDVDFDWIQKPEYKLNEREAEMESLELERKDSGRSELWKYKREPTKESRASKHSGDSGVGGGSSRQLRLEEKSRSNMSMDMVQLEQDFKKHFQLKHDGDSSDSNDGEALDDNGYRRRPHRPLEIQNERVFNERNLVADLCNKRPHLEELMNYLFLYFEFEREVSKKKHPDRKEDVALKLILEKLEYKITKISEAHRNEGSSGYYNIKFESKCGAQGESTIFGLNIFSNNRNKRSMIIEISGDTKEYILLVIGSSKKMSEVLSLTKREKITLKLVTAKQKQKGLNTIIMAKKTLKKEEVINYIRSAGKISQSARDQIEDLEKLAIEMETDLKFIGAVGLRDNIKSEAAMLTDILDGAGINFSILSGDKLDNCLTTMQKLNKAPINIENSASYFSIRFQEERKILQEMRRIFDSIYDLLQKESYQSILTVTKMNKEESLMTNPIRLGKKKRSRLHTFSVGEEDRLDKWAAVSALKPEGYKRLTKVLVISGESICTIMKSELLHSHLLALLSFTHSVIGYQFQPRHKMYFVDLLKEKGDVVMAVGDGFNDIGMLASANVGVQISNQNVPLIFGDIVIEELSDIPRLLLRSGRKLHANLMIALILILSNFTYNYTFMALCLNYLPHTTLDFGIFYWICYNLCFVYAIIFVAYNEHYTEEFTQLYPAIYQEKAIYSATFRLTLVSFFALAVAEGSYLFYLAYVFLSQDLNAQGLPISFDQVSLLFSLTALLNSTFKVWFFFSKRNIPSLVLRVLAFLLCVVSGYWLYGEKINLGMQDLRALASFAGSYYTLAYSLVPHLLTWLLVTWTKQHRFYRSTKMVEHYLRDDVPQRLATNATLLSFLYDETNPREIYVDLIGRMKRLFPDQSLIDASARRIVEIDFYESSLGINRLTNAIEDPDEARKFDHEQQKATLKRQEVILLLGAVLVGLAEWVLALSSKTYYLALALDSYTLYSVLLLGILLLIAKYRPQAFNTALIGIRCSLRTALALHRRDGHTALRTASQAHPATQLPPEATHFHRREDPLPNACPLRHRQRSHKLGIVALRDSRLVRNRELPVDSGQGLTRMFWLREVSALFVILLFRLMQARNVASCKAG